MEQKTAQFTEKDLFQSLPIGAQAEVRHGCKSKGILTNVYQTIWNMEDVEQHPAVIYYKLTQEYRPKAIARNLANELGLSV